VKRSRWNRSQRSWATRLADSYDVSLSPAATKALRKLDKPIQTRVLGALHLLRDTPRPPAAKTLVGYPSYLRIRIADYRIVYTIDDGHLRILVILVGHRSRIYKDLDR